MSHACWKCAENEAMQKYFCSNIFTAWTFPSGPPLCPCSSCRCRGSPRWSGRSWWRSRRRRRVAAAAASSGRQGAGAADRENHSQATGNRIFSIQSQYPPFLQAISWAECWGWSFTYLVGCKVCNEVITIENQIKVTRGTLMFCATC